LLKFWWRKIDLNVVIDTNVILRYLLRDDPLGFAKAKKIFESQATKFIDDLVIFELVYVLIKEQRKSREQVAELLIVFLTQDTIRYSSGLAPIYLDIFSNDNLDLVDSYLIAVALRRKEELVTFDKKMQKVYEKYLAENSV
jgi:predicted nucleic acid-binding protein